MTSFQITTKRTFDLLASSVGLLVLSPILALVAVAIRLDSPGPVFFRQTRIGRRLHPFQILKFRTMVVNASKLGPQLTAGDDPRITRVGRVLRKTKLDELPQLINVLKGEMSLVGPRPEVPRFVDMFPKDFAEILTIRPGLTDLASIRYRDEESVLQGARDPEREYVTRVLPDKLDLAKEYLNRTSFFLDLSLIFRTFLRLFR